ncbi:SDR family oxidoreductase [Sphingobium sp. HBC34]|uniref:SDR family oxidoreductase n=1 Tax=Sphingobium cyanobacteriorum TaxID=3063954 RepID=A0ABT8ZPK5_9SPHN|nr:SDR family oxidoreductase [Sphingobium sp. HBC34]MDO7836472.1 SDR family oxidoreductase [Sphingobium sp. HBC34]
MASIFDLTGKVALVTGGNRGIGYAMAEGLGKAGADIIIWGSNPLRNQEAMARLAALPVRVKAQTVNVANEDEVVAATSEALADFGRLDTVVANAGIGGKAEKFHQFTSENMTAVFDVNLKGVFWTLREAARHMVDRARAGDAGGSLIAVSSLGSLFGMPTLQAYSASKGAVNALMRSLAAEHGRFGIRANTLAPGFIDTEMNAQLHSSEAIETILPRIPVRRWGQGSDVAGIAVYLASDASSYHTGDVFVIDGGFAIR